MQIEILMSAFIVCGNKTRFSYHDANRSMIVSQAEVLHNDGTVNVLKFSSLLKGLDKLFSTKTYVVGYSKEPSQ